MPFGALTGVRLTWCPTNAKFKLAKVVVTAVATGLVKLAGITKNLVSKAGVEVLQQREVLFHNEKTLCLQVTAIDRLVVDANQLSGLGEGRSNFNRLQVKHVNLVLSNHQSNLNPRSYTIILD